MAENVAGALCYLLGLITGIIFLVLAPYNQNRNVRFHAFQSIFFNVAMIVAWIVFMIVATILAHIPILGAIIDLLLWVTLSIGWLIVWLMLMFKAYNNQRLSLPVIGPLTYAGSRVTRTPSGAETIRKSRTFCSGRSSGIQNQARTCFAPAGTSFTSNVWTTS